jgi:hypothetical protein
MSEVMTAPPGTDQQTLNQDLQLVLARVRLLAQRRAAWLNHLWHSEARADEAVDAATAQIAAIFADQDTPEQEAAWLANHALALDEQIAQVESALAEQTESRLHLLRQIFGLDQQDFDLLQTCLALALDPSLGRVYAYLQEHAGCNYVTEELAARLFGYGRCLVWSTESPLRTWGLIQEREITPGEPLMLTCDRQIRDWLLGQNELHQRLVGLAQLRPPLSPLPSWPVAQTVEFLNRTVNHQEMNRACVRVVGMPGSGRRAFAAGVSAEMGLSLLVIEADQIEDNDWLALFVWAQRQAFLDRCALAWYGQSVAQRPWPQIVPMFPMQFIIAEPTQAGMAIPETINHVVPMPGLSLDERRDLWRDYVPSAAAWPEHALDALAARHRVNVGEIAATAQKEAASAEEASTLVREGQRDRLGRLAQRLDCPFSWDDLVLGDTLHAALEDFVFEAQERAIFWEQPRARRLFPHGQGLAGLFTGAPGTGKTMAAQVIAATLGLDLFRVDLSTVVSKYVGETSQNLERILSRAAHMDIVLVFDEADAVFSKRTEVKDAHDRFANTDTNYLLQAIESYSGIVLLATNKKANLDPAFIRRLRYVLEFAQPDAEQRLRIWRQIITELAGAEVAAGLDPSLERLAGEVSLTGAQIKYAILAALFVARREQQPLNIDHVLRGLNRELLKEGRALNDREQEKLI